MIKMESKIKTEKQGGYIPCGKKAQASNKKGRDKDRH